MKTPEIVSATQGRLVLKIDKAELPQSVVQAAAFDYLDRAWIFIDSQQDAFVLTVTPRDADGASDSQLQALAGELVESLGDHHLRQQIHRDNRELLERIRQRAFGGADALADDAGPPEDDDLDDLGDLDDLDFLDDPLGIAVPWEEQAADEGGEGQKKTGGTDEGSGSSSE